MPGFNYSTASAEGRQCGLDLLELTRGYEELEVPPGLGVTNLVVLALVARAPTFAHARLRRRRRR